jgi:hypothetical protein
MTSNAPHVESTVEVGGATPGKVTASDDAAPAELC